MSLFEWSSFIGTIAIAIAKANHLKSDLLKVQISNGRISDPHC